jgi:N-acetyl-anhydromuramyl-L-alanine amidase AmpD
MRFLDLIVVHCSDTPSERTVTVDDIRKWHVEERGWDDIGYHYVIYQDGSVHKGRALDVPGAHVSGHNTHSIGICLIGGWKGSDDYSDLQLRSLSELISSLKVSLPDSSLQVKGHCDLDSGKTCPNFDVSDWWQFQ